MNKKLTDLALEAGIINYVDLETPRRYFIDGNADIPELEAFAEMIIREAIEVCLSQRNPSNLNYKPSESFADALRLHFGWARK